MMSKPIRVELKAVPGGRKLKASQGNDNTNRIVTDAIKMAGQPTAVPSQPTPPQIPPQQK